MLCLGLEGADRFDVNGIRCGISVGVGDGTCDGSFHLGIDPVCASTFCFGHLVAVWVMISSGNKRIVEVRDGNQDCGFEKRWELRGRPEDVVR